MEHFLDTKLFQMKSVVSVSLHLSSVALLGAFRILRKATVSFVIFVYPSARMQQLGSHWKDFHEIL
jgi:hypothetical protein